MSTYGKNGMRLTPKQYVRKVDSQDRRKREAAVYAQRMLSAQHGAIGHLQEKLAKVTKKRRTAKDRKIEERIHEQKYFLEFIAKADNKEENAS